MLLVLSIDDQNTNDDKNVDQQKKELNQRTILLEIFYFTYIHRSNWSPMIIKKVILKPYLNIVAFLLWEKFHFGNIIYIYNIMQTEQILCQTFPHFIRTNVS
jgi:hypothetical protein